LGEIEDYQRVQILGVESAAVVGSAAADLAHLLAELVENALTFSPPHRRVEVSGRHNHAGPYAVGQRQPPSEGQEVGAFTIAIADSGIGMAEEDIARANQRLAGKESFAIAPSQYLGHYVAGMIALRHNITVRLESIALQWTVATVTLPSSLLSSQGTDPAPAPAETVVPAAPSGPAPRQPVVVRGLHPGGPASRYHQVGAYRVGDAEFQIDFGTIDPAARPVPVGAASDSAGPGASPTAVAGRGNHPDRPQLASRVTGPARGRHGGGRSRPAGATDTTVIADAQRARYVRDTLSRFADGLRRGRGAATSEQDETATASGTDAEASPRGSDEEVADHDEAGPAESRGRPGAQGPGAQAPSRGDSGPGDPGYGRSW